MTAKAITVAAALCLSVVLASAAGAQGCPEWNLAHDFRVSPNQENPNRDNCGNANVWYYMESSPLTFPAHVPSSYTRLPEFIQDASFTPGLEEWMGSNIASNPKDKLPMVGMNSNGSDTLVLGHIVWRAGVIHIHPFANKLAVVGWRSPISGTVSMSGGVSDRDPFGGNGFSWFVDRFDGTANTTIASGVVLNGGLEKFQDGAGGAGLANIEVREGDFLYLIVDPLAGDHYYDSTELTLVIQPVAGIPVVSPALLFVLAMGLAIAGALRLARL